MSGRNQRLSDVSGDEMEADAAEDAGVDSDEEGGFRIDEDIYIPPPPIKITEQSSVDGPRLMIAKIVNENFKSYAGQQVVGPFHKCFSAIIGPNGSGKSNVIDSMLFVFGYRASKIRSKKISVLIHNSSQHPDCRSCTVAVHFQKIIDKPGSDYHVVPNSELVISRTAFKDNSSYYQINNRKVQFKEVAKVLRGNGVDLDHNRFLILQGEVEQIAMMKPKGQQENDTGMLEFLEDIIGTVRYKEPLEKLEAKVELLTEHRLERLNRLRAIEKEKNDLKEPMQDAVEYLKCENSISTLTHQLCQCRRLETEEESVELEAKKAELDADHAKLKAEMELVKTSKEEKNAELKEKCKKWDKLRNQKEQLTALYENAKKKDEQFHAELVESNKRRKANMATVKEEKQKLEELARVPEKNAKDIQECEELYERCAAEREKEEEKLTTLMNSLKDKTAPLLEQRRKFETDLIALRKDVDQAKANCDIAESRLHLYTSAEELERKKLEELQATLKHTIETLQERRAQLKTLDAKIPATSKSLAEAQKEMDHLKKNELAASNRLRDLRMQFEEQKSAMNASKSRNRVLDSLMQQKRMGNIPGLFGRLGDLGAIDSKYDVAISTACGPLDNIVVDTVDTAQHCITYLRDNDIGRATFIALEKQERFLSRCQQKIVTPENVPRLFDLIRVEQKEVLPAFYYSLQDTLVAKDLEQASRIAYCAQRHRVVTLKGELIETSGTMSGGGRSVQRGRMGQSVVRVEANAADVEKIQVNLDNVYEEYNQMKNRQQELEPQIHSLSSSLRDMQMDKEKYTIEVQSLTKQEPSLKAQLVAQKKKAAEATSDPKEVERLTKVVDAAKADVERTEDASKKIENEVNNINGKIEDISGGRVKKQQAVITELTKKTEKAKSEIYRLQVAIKTAERNSKKMTQHIETLEADIHKCENTIRKLKTDQVELEESAKEMLEKLNEVTEQLVERDEDSCSLKTEVNALQERENKMKAIKIEMDQKLGEINKNLSILQQKIPEYTKKIAGIKLHAIPGETVEELKELPEEELKEMNSQNVAKALEKAKQRLPEEIPNMKLIDEYLEKDALYTRRLVDFEDVTNQRNKLRDLYEESRRRRAQEFLSGFSIITGKLKEMYQMITLGGDAELELVDSLDPFSEGIVFSVRPPKKSWKNISNLSGGEKTLSSLALVFALHHYKPTPLYFMDEIDAALDFKNVSIVGNYIKERTKNAQFIVISLRSNMFELADYLVGIYKTYNCTKCATLDVAKYCAKNGIAPTTVSNNVKDRYGASQSARLYQTSVLTSTKQNTVPAIRATCPAIISESSSATTTSADDEDTGLSLPDLGLCPTPKAKSNGKNRSFSDNDDFIPNSPIREPSRKRRKL